MEQVILIVGASKGIGLETARELYKRGHIVYGTSRNPKSANLEDIRLLALDVRDEISIAMSVRQIIDAQGRIDVVINNAGYDLHGAAEDTQFSELKAQIDTNFYGAIRVTHAVLPFMRRQKSGRSSISVLSVAS